MYLPCLLRLHAALDASFEKRKQIPWKPMAEQTKRSINSWSMTWRSFSSWEVAIEQGDDPRGTTRSAFRPKLLFET